MKKALSVLIMLFSALAAVGSLTFLRPCVHEDGTVSVCASAGTLLMVLGFAGLAVGALTMFVRGRTLRILLSALLLAISLGLFLIPGVLAPLCMMETMRCHLITKPAARVLGALTGCCALLLMYLQLIPGRKGTDQ